MSPAAEPTSTAPKLEAKCITTRELRKNLAALTAAPSPTVITHRGYQKVAVFVPIDPHYNHGEINSLEAAAKKLQQTIEQHRARIPD
jgi:hypothetical protein